MKIDSYRQSLDIDRASRSEQTQQVDKSSTGGVSGGVKSDRVDVSSDARLLNDAVKAAEDHSGIRQDVVERMRRLRESGELGQDAGKLADSLIDAMLKNG